MSVVNNAARARCTSVRIALVAGVSLLLGATSSAQSAVNFSVSGTSTIRGWTCEVAGTTEVTPGSATPAPGFSSGVQAATLTVQVGEFECPNEEMTEHLFAALKPDEFGEIAFQLDSYETSAQGATATGTLTILDVTQSVRVPVTLTPTGQGATIEGEVSLDMTTYGVEPPVVMLGLMKVGPQIRIQFDGLIVP
ncbi:MAG: YceI family protein [Vicinamibacterales bacterium]|nr:YceI family protein [Vicinamibacterales bacterium]